MALGLLGAVTPKMLKTLVIIVIVLIILGMVISTVLGIGIAALVVLIINPTAFVMMAGAILLFIVAVYLFIKGGFPGYWRFIIPGAMVIVAGLMFTGRLVF